VQLFHATLRKRVPAIRKEGLLCRKSRGRLKAVWLHSAARSCWALVHTVRRHGGRAEGVLILRVNVPRSWLRRSQAGLWYCVKDVKPARIAAEVIDFAAVSARP
jgi:hypothetical protein